MTSTTEQSQFEDLKAEIERLKLSVDWYQKANSTLDNDLQEAVQMGTLEMGSRLAAEQEVLKLKQKVVGLEREIRVGKTPYLLELPNEILFEIAGHLGPSKDLAALCRVNKELNVPLAVEMCRLDIKERGNIGMFEAIMRGNATTVKNFLDAGASMLSSTLPQRSALDLAVEQYQTEVIRVLAEAGADVNECDNTGMTLLCKAILKTDGWGWSDWTLESSLETVQALLYHGADIHGMLAPSKSPGTDVQESPLHLALKFGDSAVVSMLINYGANVNVILPNGMTPLQYACDDYDRVKILVEEGADINAVTEDGKTAADILFGMISDWIFLTTPYSVVDMRIVALLEERKDHPRDVSEDKLQRWNEMLDVKWKEYIKRFN